MTAVANLPPNNICHKTAGVRPQNAGYAAASPWISRSIDPYISHTISKRITAITYPADVVELMLIDFLDEIRDMELGCK